MDGQVKPPKWTATATIGLVLLIILIFIAVSFVRSLIPQEDKSVTPQVSEVAFSLTQAQEKEALLLVTPLIKLDAIGFHSISQADKDTLIDAAILRLLSTKGKTFRLDANGDLNLTAADVAAEFELMFGEELTDHEGHESYDTQNAVFLVDSGLSDDEVASLYSQAESDAAASSQPNETSSQIAVPTAVYIEAPAALVSTHKEIGILSARSADELVIVTLSVSDGENEQKFELTLEDNGGYVLVSMLEI